MIFIILLPPFNVILAMIRYNYGLGFCKLTVFYPPRVQAMLSILSIKRYCVVLQADTF